MAEQPKLNAAQEIVAALMQDYPAEHEPHTQAGYTAAVARRALERAVENLAGLTASDFTHCKRRKNSRAKNDK